MHNPSQSPDAIAQKVPAQNSRTRRPILVWIVSFYSVTWAVLSYINLVDLFVGDPFASTLPVYQRLYVFFLPGLHLFSGIALFFLRKEAFFLYTAYFVALLAMPVVVSNLYVDPYLTPNWLDIYRNSAKGILGLGWLLAVLTAGYAAYLYRSKVLR